MKTLALLLLSFLSIAARAGISVAPPSSGGSITNLPSTTHLLNGNGSGGASDSGISASSVATNNGTGYGLGLTNMYLSFQNGQAINFAFTNAQNNELVEYFLNSLGVPQWFVGSTGTSNYTTISEYGWFDNNFTFLGNIKAGALVLKSFGTNAVDDTPNGSGWVIASLANQDLAPQGGAFAYEMAADNFGSVFLGNLNASIDSSTVNTNAMVSSIAGTVAWINLFGDGNGGIFEGKPLINLGAGAVITGSLSNVFNYDGTNAYLGNNKGVVAQFLLSTTPIPLSQLPATVMTNNFDILASPANGGFSGGTFWGNGSGLTNVHDNLGISIVGSNGAAASWMLGVDATGKTTTNAVPSGGSGVNYWGLSGSDLTNNNSGYVLPQAGISSTRPTVTTAGNGNEFFGYQAGKTANTSTLFTTCVGYNAGFNIAGSSQCDAFGYNALLAAVNLQAMCALGYNSLEHVTIGTSDIGIGYNALNVGTNISTSIAVGVHAGESQDNLSDATFVGYHAGDAGSGLNDLTAVGSHAGYLASAEASDFGFYSGYNSTNAAFSVNIGYQAGENCTNASGSVFIGENSGTNRANTLWIDTGASGPDSSYIPLILGYFDTRWVQIAATVVVTNTITAQGLNTVGTYTNALTSTGFTNLLGFDVRLIDLQGTGLYLTNILNGHNVSIGTISVNNDFLILHTNEAIKGTGITGVIWQ